MCEKVYVLCVQLNNPELENYERIVMNTRFQNFYWYILYTSSSICVPSFFVSFLQHVSFQQNYVVANLQTESKLKFVTAYLKRSYKQAGTS